jgi:CheY-like chemotaxis protein
LSLLGRLEDLSLTDIIQIVYLSRRTGILEIVDASGRTTILFLHGLIVNASAPDDTTLADYLVATGRIGEEALPALRQLEESGVPAGSGVLELSLLDADTLRDAIRERIVSIVRPLIDNREGEFNFILSDALGPFDIEYEPSRIFRDGGIVPQKIVGGEGEKFKPLRGLEESLRAGRELLRTATEPAPPTRPTLDLGLGHQEPEAPFADLGEELDEPFADLDFLMEERTEGFPHEESPFGELDAEPDEEIDTPLPVSADAPEREIGRFTAASPAEGIDGEGRSVVVLEKDPLVRVAVKRGFSRRNFQVAQFGMTSDARRAIQDLVQQNRFFVSFLEYPVDGGEREAISLLELVKRRNRRLPVVLIDHEPDLARRAEVLGAGADVYLTRPSPERLRPGMAEEELSLFADELVLFAKRAFGTWESLGGGGEPDAGRRFYAMAEEEKEQRSRSLLRQLIDQLSDPSDVENVGSTIVRLAGEYVDRAALFAVRGDSFVGLLGSGSTGVGEGMNERVRTIRIPKSAESVLRQVTATGRAHRGKIRRTPANEQLIRGLGAIHPTEIVALPIVNRERVVGLLYGDNAENHVPIDGISGLEIFVSQAGQAFEKAIAAGGRDEA